MVLMVKCHDCRSCSLNTFMGECGRLQSQGLTPPAAAK
uniref:Uncharacterized protein n=1 Tax=Anguilla anguilla TaxID=7936 RepID=A0A0E9Q9P3_ANGAN